MLAYSYIVIRLIYLILLKRIFSFKLMICTSTCYALKTKLRDFCAQVDNTVEPNGAAKLITTFADRGCRLVVATVPVGR
jgi:hypothetical protein